MNIESIQEWVDNVYQNAELHTDAEIALAHCIISRHHGDADDLERWSYAVANNPSSHTDSIRVAYTMLGSI